MTQGTIDRDIPCRGCGRSLRGILFDDPCPDCAQEIPASINQWLATIDPSQPRNLANASLIALVISLLHIPLFVQWIALFSSVYWFEYLDSSGELLNWLINQQVYVIAVIAIDFAALVFLIFHRDRRAPLIVLVVAALMILLNAKAPPFFRIGGPSIILVFTSALLFAALSFFWCHSAAQTLKKIGDDFFARELTAYSVVLPLGSLLFLLGAQIHILTFRTLNELFFYKPAQAFEYAGIILLVITLLAFSIRLWLVEGRVRQTIPVAQHWRDRGISPNPDSHQNIDRDLPCQECGYNLRSLNAAGKCPECGLHIAYSIDNWLHEVDPNKSSLLTSGANLAVICCVVRIPVAIIWLLLVFDTGISNALANSYAGWVASEPWVHAVFLTLDCIAFIFLSTLRHWHVRYFLPVLAFFTSMMICAALKGTSPELCTAFFAIAENIFFMGIAFFWCLDARGIARRAGEAKIAARLSLLMWMLPIAAFLLAAALDYHFIFGAYFYSYHYGSMWSSSSAATQLMMFFSVLILVPSLTIMSVCLLQLRSRLKRTAVLAAAIR